MFYFITKRMHEHTHEDGTTHSHEDGTTHSHEDGTTHSHEGNEHARINLMQKKKWC